MSKTHALHPKAYLTSRRNVKAGLISRTKILLVLEKGPKSAGDTAKEAALTYDCVTYHIKSMKRDHLVDRVTKRKPFKWEVTRFGQQRLPTP